MSTIEHSLKARFLRLLRHVRNGTLMQRIRFGWEGWKREKYAQRWHRAITTRGYMDCQINSRARLRLYADSVLSELICLREFEIKERLFVRRYLRPGDIFIDVGANIGLFSIEAATVVGEEGAIYAFEPNPKVFGRLQENIDLNRLKNVFAIQSAVGSKPGNVALKVAGDGYDAWSSLGEPIAGADFESIEVQSITIDDFVRGHQFKGRVAMIKLDVEGWETSVLQGGAELLSRDDAPLLQVEFTSAAAQNAGSSCGELFQMILDFGYTLYKYDPSANTLHLVEENLDWGYENLFATKNIDEIKRRLNSTS